jgi:diguanylate cyclase (GGDEF)-like protein
MAMQERTSIPVTPVGLVHIADDDATPSHRIGAVITALLIGGLFLIAAMHGHDAMPVVPAFLPIATTLWFVADMFTAFLLLSHFSVTGIWGYIGIAAAYAICGLLSIPYAAFSPALFDHSGAMGRQIAISTWAAWQVFFPLIVIGCSILDPTYSRRVALRTSVARIIGMAMMSIAVCVVLVEIIAGHLPASFPLGTFALATIAINTIAVVVMWARSPKKTVLTVWLSISLLFPVLDALMSVTTHARYDVGWYGAHIVALVAANMVFFALLGEANRLHRMLVRIASSDVLTGLCNRRSADEYLTQTIEQIHARGGSVAVLVIDIDDFKPYNDRYGHMAGDLAVRAVADALTASVSRSPDLVARYGGEEFVVVLPDCTLAGAEAIAERMRSQVEALGIDHASSRGGSCITVSIGVAQSDNPTTAEPLIELADKALYEAKHAGRNRCAVGRLDRCAYDFHILSPAFEGIVSNEGFIRALS